MHQDLGLSLIDLDAAISFVSISYYLGLERDINGRTLLPSAIVEPEDRVGLYLNRTIKLGAASVDDPGEDGGGELRGDDEPSRTSREAVPVRVGKDCHPPRLLGWVNGKGYSSSEIACDDDVLVFTDREDCWPIGT